MIVGNHETFRVLCQGIVMKTVYLLSDVLLLVKLLIATGHHGLSQPPMALFRGDIIDASTEMLMIIPQEVSGKICNRFLTVQKAARILGSGFHRTKQ
jgi:hypothetical protein